MSETVNNLKWRALFAEAPHKSAPSNSALWGNLEQAAMALIADGLDYASEDENGNSLFGSMNNGIHSIISGKTHEKTHVLGAQLDPQLRLLTAMIMKGFNPLELKKTIENISLFDGLPLSRAIDRTLVLLEGQGRRMRDARGGNLFHMAATQSERMLRALDIMSEQSRWQDEPSRNAYIIKTEWLREAMIDGATPLHVLWRQEQTKLQLLDDPFISRNEVNGECARATLRMITLGADLLAPDFSGVTPLGLIEQLPREYVKDDTAEKVAQVLSIGRAQQQAQQLDRETPQAVGRSKSGPRL